VQIKKEILPANIFTNKRTKSKNHSIVATDKKNINKYKNEAIS